MYPLVFYKKFAIAASVFIVSGIAALAMDQPILLAIPFAWLLLPVALNFVLNKPQWLFYLLLFLLPLSTEYNFTPSLGIDFPDEILLMFITGLLLLFWIHKPSSFPLTVANHPIFLILVLHVLWIFITCIFSTNAYLSFKFLAAKFWFIIPLAVLPSMLHLYESSLKKMAYLLLIPMLFVVVQSLARHSRYGFSFEGIKETLSPFFRNHVNYSAMLVCLLPVLIAIRNSAKKQHKIYWNSAMVIAFAGLIFAYSRGAWLAAFCGLAGMYIIKLKVVKHALLIVLIAVSAATIWLVSDNKYLSFAPDYNSTIFHENIGEHLAATVQLKDVSNAERFYRWVAAGNMIAEKPVLGFGPNTFYNNYKSYTERPFATWVSDNPEHSTVHNYFLQTMLEQGIPGFILFIMLYAGMLLHCQKIYHAFNNNFYKNMALTIGVVLIMIGTLLCSSDLLETDKIGSLFWLSLGLIFVLQKQLIIESTATKNSNS